MMKIKVGFKITQQIYDELVRLTKSEKELKKELIRFSDLISVQDIKLSIKEIPETKEIVEKLVINLEPVEEREPFCVGQEVVCPDGLGRIVAFDLTMPNNWVEVDTYYGHQKKWDSINIRLIPIGKTIDIPENVKGKKSC